MYIVRDDELPKSSAGRFISCVLALLIGFGLVAAFINFIFLN